MYQDRYKELKVKGITIMPSVVIDKRTTDYYIEYNEGTRFDKLADKYYGDAFLEWVIGLANRNLGLTQFDIEPLSIIRIPFPIESVLIEIDTKIRNEVKNI